MKYDIYANFHISTKGKENKSDLPKELSIDTRMRLLAKYIWKESEERSRFIDILLKTSKYKNLIEERLKLMSSMNTATPNFEKITLIPGSWMICFTFKLAKPYISKDDDAFYMIDNPIKKEKVFKVPYVSGSTWKGALRSAIRLNRGWDDSKEEMIQLFGNPREDESQHRSGSLIFFPTFFNNISLEVINPHLRKEGSGTQPIYFECVPQDAEGTFALLNYPIYGTQNHALESLSIVASGIERLFLDFGFGAKTSSGFGVAKNELPQNKDVRGLLVLSQEGKTKIRKEFTSISELSSIPKKSNESIDRRCGQNEE